MSMDNNSKLNSGSDLSGCDGVRDIKILGTGCKRCHTLYEDTLEAVKAAGLSVNVTYITDIPTIMEYGVMSLPALIINEQVVSMGKALSVTSITQLLKSH